ncbi:MAG: hypothetical protein EBU90_16245 [Proteobacteria bacterium]|nr:hypothetical protein [Pseudomonadota bacterium]
MTDTNLNQLIKRAGFSNTFERTRLERLIWLTALDLQQFVSEEQWQSIVTHLAIPDQFNKRVNNNYLTKTKSDQPEGYME